MNTRDTYAVPSILRRAVDDVASAIRASSEHLSLVPSEAQLSPLARLPLNTDLYCRYFFNEYGDPDFWQFRGGQDVGHLEHQLIVPALCRLARSRYANIRPLSGLNAMLLVLSALGGTHGGSIVCVAPQTGGHFATAAVIRRLGRHPEFVEVHDGEADVDQLTWALRRAPVPLVYLDLQNTLVPLDLPPIVSCIEHVSPSTRLHVDCSHTLGLIFGGVHPNPLELGADSFGGSTHKSFPGPQKGVIFTNCTEIAEQFRQAQFDLVSSHHFAETLALGLAAAEFEVFGRQYARAVVANARALAFALRDEGLAVAGRDGSFTHTHQVWVSVGDLRAVTTLGDRLAVAGILANVQDNLPGLPGPAFRLGVNEITFEGAGRSAMKQIARAIAAARVGPPAITASDVRSTFGAPYHYPTALIETLVAPNA